MLLALPTLLPQSPPPALALRAAASDCRRNRLALFRAAPDCNRQEATRVSCRIQIDQAKKKACHLALLEQLPLDVIRDLQIPQVRVSRRHPTVRLVQLAPLP